MTDSDGLLERGQLYWIDWSPGRGSEQTGRRPGLIVQADPINRSTRYTNTIVVALSSVYHPVPTHIAVEPSNENGLGRRSYILCEQIQTVSRERVKDKIGCVDHQILQKVDSALKRVLALA